MTGNQLITRLKVKLNQLDTSSNRVVRPEVALLFLNEAYLKLVRAKYKLSTGIPDETHFQGTQLVTDELNHLTTSAQLPMVLGTDPETTYELAVSDIPNYWIHLRSRLQVSYKGTSAWVSDINYKTIDTLNPSTLDPFNRPEPLNPTLYFDNGKLKSPCSGYTVLNIHVSYLKYPTPIIALEECIAPFQDEIVNMAAIMILEDWGDVRSQSLAAVEQLVKAQ